MFTIPPVRPLVLLNSLLLAATAATILAATALDRATPAVEAAVERYARAVGAQDLAAASAELAPDARAEWTPWVAGQLGNVYEIRGTAVRFPSLLHRLSQGAPGKPYEVTVAMDVNRAEPDIFYQPTTRVPVEEVDGRWYLSRPLLQPEAEVQAQATGS